MKSDSMKGVIMVAAVTHEHHPSLDVEKRHLLNRLGSELDDALRLVRDK